MHIVKILRAYLVFILTITAASLLTYSDTAKLYLASVLHSSKENIGEVKSNFPMYIVGSVFQKNEKNFVMEKEFAGVVNFFISQNKENSYAAPGAKNAPIMELNFKSGKDTLELKNLRLKVAGVEAEKIEGIYLSFNDKNLKGRKNDSYFVFENINYKLTGGMGGIISVSADLSAELKTGQRLRLDIEKPEDIGLEAAGKSYRINGFYPIKGEYLTISKPRL